LHDAQRNVEIARAQMDHQRDAMKHQQLAMEEVHAQMETLHQGMRALQDEMEALEEALKEELIKDGYIGTNEKVETINWSNDDVLTVNGKKIKESDQAKYVNLQKKFFKDEMHYGRPE
jgi:bla regulator protein blaR1